MDRQSWVRLAYSRPGGPLMIVLLFTLCSTPFLLLGSALNTSYKPVTALPLYPDATALTLPTATTLPVATTVGLMSMPTIVPVILPEGLPIYTFFTDDSHSSVVLYYKTMLLEIYGQQGVELQALSPVTTIITGSRHSLYNVWVVEQTIVTITTTDGGTTHVEIAFTTRRT